MRHQKNKGTLDRLKAPREAMLKNLAASIVLYEKVKTTAGKARVVRPLVEKMITFGKNPTLANRRRMYSFFHTENPVKKIVEDLGKRYAERHGGYTRTVKLGERQGDGASIVQIELI